MNNKQRKAHYAPLVEATGIFELHDVININFKPHPYMVGPRHVSHAADHHGGMLGDATLEAIPCAHRGCNLMYDQHVSDCVMALKLTRDATETEAQKALQSLVEQGMEGDGIDGFIFIENKPYTFTKGETDGEETEEAPGEEAAGTD